MNKAAFVAKFHTVFEHSPWVAESVFEKTKGQAIDAEALVMQFETAFLESDPALQLETLRAHPQLSCALAAPDQVTRDSMNEQSGAGLDQCSVAELAEFSRLNTGYNEKFGFPFIIAVKGRSRYEILNVFRQRIENDPQQEFQNALKETRRIARFRIMDIING